ncbi:hypothetical protein [Xylanimonas allomyrinae]|uniref:hypothetical protein n=1 Tax=Xylanimonas allomyrinae TaxID=2509459 RepID=UPI0013A64158|nr:hypothetical protein [Xylanimonas allomyrinae]
MASPAPGWTAQAVSTPVAMVVGGGFSVRGALCFLPAVRQGKALRATGLLGASV